MANSLQLAADLLLFEQARVHDPVANAALAAAAARLAAVGQLHRFLSVGGPSATVDVRPFLTELCGLIAGSTGLSCSLDADAADLPAEAAQQLAIAINELAMNAAKHAYRAGAPGGLHIEARRMGAKLRLVVSDDGAGLARDFTAQPGHGLGMSILQAIVRQLDATFEAESDHGARFTITLPLTAARARPSRSFAPVNRP